MKLSDLKIGTKLNLGFGAIVALLVLLVAIAYGNFSRLEKANNWNIHTYQVMAEVKGMLESLINIETGQRGFALTAKEASLEPYIAGKAAFFKHLDATKSLTADNAKQQERLVTLAQEEQQWRLDAIDPVIKLRREPGEATMQAVVTFVMEGKGKKGMDAMRGLLTDIYHAEESLLEQRLKDAEALHTLTGTTLIGGGIVATLLAALLAAWLRRSITRPLRSAVAVAKQVAEGDLRIKIETTSGDETGELLNALKSMSESLSKTVSAVRSGTDTIASASSQVANGNQDLSSRTEQQASSLEETASSMEELTATVKQNADNARQANSLAETASQIAGKGGHVISQVVGTMSEINVSANKIVDIIGVIDGIAFQTNILALNAAVEAARAGEQGRGFAVVASEVRNLAQRSAAAAKEIKSLIGDSVDKVENGSKLVNEAGATMQEIVASVRRVTDIMAEIAAASQEQTEGIEQINQAITQMDEVTQQNASLVEEAAAASELLQDQAANLAQVVSVFKLDGMQSGFSVAAAAPALRASQALRPKKFGTKAVSKLVRPAAKPVAASSQGGEWEEF